MLGERCHIWDLQSGGKKPQIPEPGYFTYVEIVCPSIYATKYWQIMKEDNFYSHCVEG